MDTETYWQLVDEARDRAGAVPGTAAEPDEVAQALRGLLVERGVETTRAAYVGHQRVVRGAYGWPLWGAAYVINGGCSDDGFEYFRGWLVAQGREAFERAVTDPDSLADLVDEETEAEGEDALGAPWLAYRELTGEDLTFEARELADLRLPELGPSWDFDDEAEMRARYPRLTAVFFDG